MVTDGRQFDTNVFFSGGAGMFIQYHDIIKPAYLYAIIKMIVTKESFGLPIDIIKDFSFLSITEWYMNRRFKNPLQCLDFNHSIDPKELDDLMNFILLNDDSIYKYSPALNFKRMLNVYRQQHMSFPIYVYSENEEPYIKEDCKSVFQGINFKYLHGDLKSAIQKCDQNFTYIFSDIELVKEVSDILIGTCSHILLASEYRYNYIDNGKSFKYNLTDLATSHPFIRIGLTTAIDVHQLAKSFTNLSIAQQQGGTV